MTFYSAFILGLLASVHCAAMCSGIHFALQAQRARGDLTDLLTQVLPLHLGKLITYALLGWGFAAISGAVFALISLEAYTSISRAVTAGVVILIGVQLCFPQAARLNPLDRLGRMLWATVNKLAWAQTLSVRWPLVRGMLWGLLPCGLLYSVLLAAAITGEPWFSSWVMVGFGLGTLPALFVSGALLKIVPLWLEPKTATAFAGASLVIAGLVGLLVSAYLDMAFTTTYPGLISTTMCMAD